MAAVPVPDLVRTTLYARASTRAGPLRGGEMSVGSMGDASVGSENDLPDDAGSLGAAKASCACQEFVMLRIEIIGNLGSDPEQRFTGEGVAMTSIRVAVNSRRRNAEGEQVERTDWFRVRTMGGKAEYVQRFTKGQRVR